MSEGYMNPTTTVNDCQNSSLLYLTRKPLRTKVLVVTYTINTGGTRCVEGRKKESSEQRDRPFYVHVHSPNAYRLLGYNNSIRIK